MKVRLHEQSLDEDEERGGLEGVKANGAQNFQLHLHHFVPPDLAVGHFVHHSGDLKGNNFLLLAGNEHCRYSYQVDLFHTQGPLAPREEQVHDVQGDKEGVGGAVEGGEHLDHPVHHPSPHFRVDAVSGEQILSEVRPALLEFMAQNAFEVPSTHLFRFSNDKIFFGAETRLERSLWSDRRNLLIEITLIFLLNHLSELSLVHLELFGVFQLIFVMVSFY